ncbi:hypothetical protein Kpol_505p10 [Vanderwaltozyma polyspora DSM 70294]|uniref:phosphoinositide 5-phosphatase n=1 Tax=Vanderwaltozyma polyspora (strain ATCC 22028 / DSM 70294 / BCRC 21397 / CBS 2163 / NBRC 10782 / NRRL Y-8283 / UCD 57-17) TaxID=436907 RepID=A7TNA1_VANPO|nr:uncharacterized protein Kpol_505p10 [Vanderwaltozyma polyspora DSM 70294]EDO16233.1 hypothetical protein Kpol_505p10 [Vanderwaltozyma polyspora DSM 70294]
MIIVLSTEGERRIAIVSESFALVFKPAFNKEKQKTVCNVDLVPKKELKNQGFQKLSSNEIFGFIGLIEIDGLIFIGTIIGKSKVAQPIPGETINKIHGVDFFCLNDSTWDYIPIDQNGYPTDFDRDSAELQAAIPRHPCFELRKLLSNGSFYYSSDFDLTSTLQHRGYGTHSLSSDTYEQEYMWNYFMMKEVIQFRDGLDSAPREILDDDGFLTTVICGFAETIITKIHETKVALTIISKQSWKRAGTRYNVRGVDDESNVANFVETEFILYSLKYCYAFTEIRGSIPVFWEQDTSMINPKVKIRRSIEATQPVFDKHFERLINKYGSVNIVNLLAYKTSEIGLSQRYKEQLTDSKKLALDQDIFMTNFDFHKETSGEGFSGVKKLIPLITENMLSFGYFSYDVKAKQVLSEQNGVFRTNCLDCLDRTNVAQQVISYYSFRSFLEAFRLINPTENIDDSEFITKLNILWADNGDQISQIYTGTNALKSSFSRKGKMSFAGLLSDATKSVSRIYVNTFVDNGKQQSIDFLLGRLPNQKPVEMFDPMSQYIQKKLELKEMSYTSTDKMQVLAGTFNVNASTDDSNLSCWLYPIGNKFVPDVVILGFQEVIELSATSIMNADYSKSSFWETAVNKCLNQFGDKYLLLRVEQVTSLLILFFVKADKAEHVKDVEGASKKTGFGGMAGNKGAVAIRFNYGETSFCFINSHFAAGDGNLEDRRNNFNNIIRNIVFTRSKTIFNHDSIFWFGDLNYRVNLANDLVRYELEKQRPNYLQGLLKFDQLTQEIKTGIIFEGFKEPPITFNPTYKYDNGTDIYDTSEKARTPSWTDRIVYKGDNITPLSYSDAAMLISDHRPVYGAYRTTVKFVDDEVKNKLMRELRDKFKADNLDLYPKLTKIKSDVDVSFSESDHSQSGSPLFDITESPSTDSIKETLLKNQNNLGKLSLRPPPPPATIIDDTLSNQANDSYSAEETEVEKKSLTNPISPSKSRPLPPGFSNEVLSAQPANKGDSKEK